MYQTFTGHTSYYLNEDTVDSPYALFDMGGMLFSSFLIKSATEFWASPTPRARTFLCSKPVLQENCYACRTGRQIAANMYISNSGAPSFRLNLEHRLFGDIKTNRLRLGPAYSLQYEPTLKEKES